MAITLALRLSKWTLDVVTRLVKARVRVHNTDVITDDMAIIFVANHFTRLETLLLPYYLLKATGKEIWSLAAAELFRGRIGQFLRKTGTVSTADPDRDKTIVHTLLKGEHPWIIFPEGAMIKDKKVVNTRGEFEVCFSGVCRPPHTGAGVMALRAEFYRQKLACLFHRPGQEGLENAMKQFELKSVDDVITKRTVMIPVNITYYPIRSGENIFLRLVGRLKEGLSLRAIEELSVEGTVLSADTDIDITLGTPIEVGDFLNAPEYSALMTCGENDLQALELDPSSLFNNASRQLMQRYMKEIYALTTVNTDHVMTAMLRHQPCHTFEEQVLRHRFYLCCDHIAQLPAIKLHPEFKQAYHHALYREPSSRFDDSLQLCIREGLLTRVRGGTLQRQILRNENDTWDTIRVSELTRVIANEIEPIDDVFDIIRRYATMPDATVTKTIREQMIQCDLDAFESYYSTYYDETFSKEPAIGRPFLLKPRRVKGGVVLSHGYLAAPTEIKMLAKYLCKKGYVVYGVRLPGHGTSPDDLSQVTWEDWYDAYNRGYAILSTYTDNIILGGFSMGGCLALLAAARKGKQISGVFSINAPLQVHNYSIHLAPTIVTINALLKKIGRDRSEWEAIKNEPENMHINYTKNPLAAVRELSELMSAMEECLSDIACPALLVQAAQDPVVNPISAQLIFERLGTPRKEIAQVDHSRHGIVNGAGREEIFDRIYQFTSRLSPPQWKTEDSTEDVAS